MKSLTGATASFNPTCSMPEDGVDPRTAASLETGRQALIDNDAYLNAKLTKQSNAFPTTVTSRALAFGAVQTDLAKWQYLNGYVRQTDVSGSTDVKIDLPSLPTAVTLTSLVFRITGGPSHGALPANMPQVKLLRFSSDVASVVANTTDGSATVAIYESFHDVTLTLSHVVDGSMRYFAQVLGESGANAQVGLEIVSIKAAWSL